MGHARMTEFKLELSFFLLNDNNPGFSIKQREHVWIYLVKGHFSYVYSEKHIISVE